jgi:hypothetical protein
MLPDSPPSPTSNSPPSPSCPSRPGWGKCSGKTPLRARPRPRPAETRRNQIRWSLWVSRAMSIKTKKPICPIWAARPGYCRCLRLHLVQKQAQCLSPKQHRRRKIRRAPNLWIFFLLKRTLAHSTPRARNTSEGGPRVPQTALAPVTLRSQCTRELLGLPLVLRSGSAGAEGNATLPPGHRFACAPAGAITSVCTERAASDCAWRAVDCSASSSKLTP